ncbi:ABC transporter ATP-binding protein [Rhizobium helianthi]|uniref:ABC transporter ATP-binding protein n=1 Tax=Rhizobium helianthi TaxID=1132695 RepID=A0ABW4M3R2_9HYPH
MGDQTFLELRQVASTYGATQVLKGIDLTVEKGEFVALLGSSGCGKTTLLRLLAGFVAPSQGTVQVAGRDISRLPPDRRGMALMFQSYALWPHMTVAQNIGYGLKLRKLPSAEIGAKVEAVQSLLGLHGLGQRKPSALSGGQRQRVALARALVIDPEILLLDEPLSNLDARIRLTVRHELRALQQRLGITAIHVTHDREEAMVMADRIVILNGGQIAQQGRPEEVYNNPASSFVAAFMGAENLLTLQAEVEERRVRFASFPGHRTLTMPVPAHRLASGMIEARFRPEAAQLFEAGSDLPEDGGQVFDGRVLSVSYPGGHWRHVIRLGDKEVMADAPRAFAPGSDVVLRVANENFFAFNPAA